jgi:hypothetical protein
MNFLIKILNQLFWQIRYKIVYSSVLANTKAFRNNFDKYTLTKLSMTTVAQTHQYNTTISHGLAELGLTQKSHGPEHSKNIMCPDKKT